MNRYRIRIKQERKVWTIVILLLWALLLSFVVHAQVNTTSGTPLMVLRKDDDGGMLKLILANAPKGLYMYDITVSIRDSGIARIGFVRGVAIAGIYFQVMNKTASSIEFRAADLDGNSVLPGAHDVTLAEIEVLGLKRGQTGIDVTVNQFIDDEDRRVIPQVEPIVLEIFNPIPELLPIGGSINLPQDLNGNGLNEDINGDRQLTPADLSLFALNIDNILIQTHVECFDFNGDGAVNLADVRALAALIEEANPLPTDLRLEDGRGEIGEEVALNLLLVRAPQGLQRYDVVVSVSASSVAQIKGVRSDAIDSSFFQILRQSPNLIEFRAADFKNQIQPNAEEIILATIVLVGMSKGETGLDTEVQVMTDDNGNPLKPLLRSGKVEITLSLPPVGGSAYPPRDLNGNGCYEDITGDGVLTFADPILLAFNLDSNVIQENPALFDFNGDGRVDFNDAGALAALIEKGE